MVYNPYQGGWRKPSWWMPTRRLPELGPWDVRPGEQNAAKFLNMLIPMMRNQEDMLALARAVNALGGGRLPGYGEATRTRGKPFRGDPSKQYQQAFRQFKWRAPNRPETEANRALKAWLQGVWSLGKQYQKGPVAPGTGRRATRQQEMGFGRELRQSLQGGPKYSELYAPWLQRLFMPTQQRAMPGQWRWGEEAGKYQLTKQPRFW